MSSAHFFSHRWTIPSTYTDPLVTTNLLKMSNICADTFQTKLTWSLFLTFGYITLLWQWGKPVRIPNYVCEQSFNFWLIFITKTKFSYIFPFFFLPWTNPRTVPLLSTNQVKDQQNLGQILLRPKLTWFLKFALEHSRLLCDNEENQRESKSTFKDLWCALGGGHFGACRHCVPA